MSKAKKTKEEMESLVNAIDSVKLQAIKTAIGYGYVKKLQEFIRKREKTKLTTGYIRSGMVIHGESRNNRILYYALLLASESEAVSSEDINQAKSFLANLDSKYAS